MLSGKGGLRANYASYDEMGVYLHNLNEDYDSGGFLEIIDIGRSVDMGPKPGGGYQEDDSGSMLVARITEGVGDPATEKPRILLICGEHAHEWIPQETCLGLVDWLVQKANAKNDGTEADEVKAMLGKAEVWVLVQANPSGRLADDTASGDPMHEPYLNQRKNHQWGNDMACEVDNPPSGDVSWKDIARSGRCAALDTNGLADWEKFGINLNATYSVGWAPPSTSIYGRNYIVGAPNDEALASARAPEEYPCTNSNECATNFPSHPNCVEYRDAVGNPVSGCFMRPARNSFHDCDMGQLALSDEHGIAHAACLETDVGSGTTAWLLWECGQTNTQRSANSFPCNSLAFPDGCPSRGIFNGLLDHCDQGVLVTCRPSNGDSTCRALYNRFNVSPFDTVQSHLYCDEHTGYCAIDAKQTCCSINYHGRRPFEAMESRALRDLVNNVPFSVVLNMHSARAGLGLICTGSGHGCGVPALTNGEGMRDAMRTAFEDAARAAWNMEYGGTPEDVHGNLSFPSFLSLLPDTTGQAGLGQIQGWLANKVNHGVFHSVTVPETKSNFDYGTLRAIPTFLLELGAQKPDEADLTDGFRALYARLNDCDTGVQSSASRPKSSVMVLNQLAGTKGILTYLVEQAVTPQTAAGASGNTFLTNPTDVAISGLTVGDAGGRGVQQTELRWTEIASDPMAEIAIPAGLWDVSVELAAGASAQGAPVLLDLFWDEMEYTGTEWADKTSATDRYVAEKYPVSLNADERRRLDFGVEFEADKVYRLTAIITESGSGDITESNNTRVAMFKVLKCGDNSDNPIPHPNGLRGYEFCANGLPRDNAAFNCNLGNGRCQECSMSAEVYSDECSPRGDFGFCHAGICDGLATCWSGRMPDRWEGTAADGPENTGLGTYQWEQTFYAVNATDDQDTARFAISGPVKFAGEYAVEIGAYDMCEPFWFGPSRQIEVMVGLELPMFQGLKIVKPLENWKIPDKEKGLRLNPFFMLSAELTNDESAALESGTPLIVQMFRSPVGGYTPTHDFFRYQMTVTVKRIGQKTGDIGSVGKWRYLDFQDIVVFKNLVGTPIPDPTLVPVLFFAEIGDDVVERGDRVYLRRDVTTGGPSVDIDLVVVDADEMIVAESGEDERGLFVSLGELDPNGGPYAAKVFSEDGSVLDSLYLCPSWVEVCADYDPTEEACGGACRIGSECCPDENVGSVSGCVDVQSDPDNCGGCGRMCDPGETCQKGACVGVDGPFFWDVTCPDRMKACPGKTWWAKDATCKALKVDNTSCGICGFACPANMRCANGLCVPRCGTSCDKECADGKSCCWVLGVKKCFDLSRSALNCGACGHACGSGEVCSAGQCTKWFQAYDPCPGAKVNCGRDKVECVDVRYDEENCGSCRFECPDEVGCENGRCVDRRPPPVELTED